MVTGYATKLASALTLALPLSIGASAAFAQDDMVEAGKKIFLETAGDVGCASCHREDASGDVGPNIQGMDVDTILNALHGGVEDMGFIELSDTEVEQVAAFLATLN